MITKDKIKKIFSPLVIETLFIVFVIFIIFVYSNIVSNKIYTANGKQLQEIVNNFGSKIVESANNQFNHIYTINSYFNSVSSPEERKTFIEDEKSRYGFSNFYFLNGIGQYISADGKKGAFNLGVDYINAIKNNQNYMINSVVFGNYSETLYIMPVNNGVYEGFPYKALAIGISSEEAQNILKTSLYSGEVDFCEVNSKGTILLTNTRLDKSDTNIFGIISNKVEILKPSMEEFREDVKFCNNFFGMSRIAGVKKYIVCSRLNYQDWVLLAAVPQRNVDGAMFEVRFMTILIVSAMILILAVSMIILIVIKNRRIVLRKNSELRYREELFSVIAGQSNEMFAMFSADNFKYRYVSQNSERMLGISDEELKKGTWGNYRLLSSVGNPEQFEEIKNLKIGEQRTVKLSCTNLKTKKLHWYEETIVKINVDGDGEFILVLKDCTEDEFLRQQLIAAKESSDSANKAKTSFLNRMSHDIRTPLNGIMGMLRIAKDNMDCREKLSDALNKIDVSANVLLTLINDVLELSRIESGKTVIAHEPMNLENLLEDCIGVMRGYIADRKLELVLPEGGFDHPFVFGDELHLRQVLLNIMSNAVKYTPDGGVIEIFADEGCNDDETVTFIHFGIRDTGIGMSEEFQKHIFEPFSREENQSASFKYKSTGLGMSIVKEFVEMMGGHIYLKSILGEGTEIIIELSFDIDKNPPVIETDSVDSKNLDNDKFDFDETKVLLVEDNELNREIASLLLQNMGIEIVEAVDGIDAVDKFRLSQINEFDWILMDIMMPGMNGYEATTVIRNMDRPDSKTVPIIAMTANAFAEDIKESLASGMNCHISKPIDPAKVSKALAKLLIERRKQESR